MPIETSCQILSVQHLYEGGFSMWLDGGAIAREAKAGQFVHIKCGAGLLLRRPISICDVAGERLRIVFEVRGEGTQWLAARTQGETLDVLGPLGHGFQLDAHGKVLVVGGGIGVPPMLYTARAAEKAVACLGFRSAQRSMLVEEFRSVCQGVYLTSDDGTLGEHGFVDALVAKQLEKEKDFTAVLACGPKLMLKSVARVAEQFGVPCQVSMEERMGCGVGACLVCACKTADGHYKHACKDGPVFPAQEVDWNE